MKTNTNVPLVNFRRVSVPTPWWVVVFVVTPVLLWRLARLLVWVTVFAVKHLRALIVLVAVWWAWHRYGWLPLVLVATVAAGLVGVWWWRHPRSCERFALFPLLSAWRRLWVYPRQWDEAMTLCGLVKTYDGGRKLPHLGKVRCTYATDEVTLRMPRGQNPDLYHKAALGRGTGRVWCGWCSSAAIR